MFIPEVFASQSGLETGFGEYLNKIFLTIWHFGGMPFVFLIASIVLLIIGIFKFSKLRPLWDRLGRFKPLAAPLISLVLGIFTLSIGEESLNLHGILAYLFAGSGAIILHDVLDAVKSLPGISPAYTMVIESIQGLLRQSIIKNRIDKKENDSRHTNTTTP